MVATSTVHDAPADAKATDIKTVLTALEVSIDRDFGETQDHAAALGKLAEQLDPLHSEVATSIVKNIESFEFELAKKEISRLKDVI